jgi:DNA-binding response OmpR family regulator
MAVHLGAWFADGHGWGQGKAAANGDSYTILVVDDESGFREVLACCLETRGFRVLKAANGREALACLEDRLAEVALVITDIVMPAMDGLELAAELGRRAPEMPLLLITGMPGLDPCCDGRTLPLLMKPFRFRELLRHVQALLGPCNGAGGSSLTGVD